MMHLESAFLYVLAVTSFCLAQAHNEMSIATSAPVEALAVARNGKVAAGLGKDGKVWVLMNRLTIPGYDSLSGCQRSLYLAESRRKANRETNAGGTSPM